MAWYKRLGITLAALCTLTAATVSAASAQPRTEKFAEWRLVEKQSWATVVERLPSKPFFNTSPQYPLAQVGNCPDLTCPSGPGEIRTYLQFDTSFLAGKNILEAALTSVVVYSATCLPRTQRVWSTKDPISTDTTWDHKPDPSSDTSYVAFTAQGARLGCDGAKPIQVDVRSLINPTGSSTFFLAAEPTVPLDRTNWRKYDSGSTRLVIRYE